MHFAKKARASLDKVIANHQPIAEKFHGLKDRDHKKFHRGAKHPSELVISRKYDKQEGDMMYLSQFEDASELPTFFEKTPHRANSFIASQDYVGRSRTRWMMGSYKDRDAQMFDKVLDKVDSGTAVGDVLTYMDEFRDELELSGALDLSETIKNCKRTRRFNAEGGELDIDRVMEGSEDYWMQTKRDGKQEFLRIVINLSLSCGNTSEAHAKLLASGLVTAETLEKLGYGTEIYVGYFGSLGWDDDTCERGWMVKVKDCTEHLDEQRIASLGCSGMQRVFSFGMNEYLYNKINHYCREATDEMIDFMGADVYIGQQWTKEGRQVELIKKAVLKIAEGR